jgi:hypothetical protein
MIFLKWPNILCSYNPVYMVENQYVKNIGRGGEGDLSNPNYTRGCQTFDHDHDHYRCKNAKSYHFDDLVAYYYIMHVAFIFPPN